MSLQNQVALVTGGYLGSEVSKSLAKQGATIAYTYRSKKEVADETLKSLGGGQHKAYQASFVDAASVENLFKAVLKDFGKIDIVVNNVGNVVRKPISEITEEEFDQSSLNNTKIAFFFIQNAARHVSVGGSILTTLTSLLSAYTGFYGLYAGTKASVDYFSKAAAKELIDKRINVNSVAPGPISTPFLFDSETPETLSFHKSQALEGRLTNVDDVAKYITFLVTDGKWINGQLLHVNGGYTTR